MPITLILAIIDLIIKLPSIIQTIRDIIAAIHSRPIHLQGPAITKLSAAVFNAHAQHFSGGAPLADLTALADQLKVA